MKVLIHSNYPGSGTGYGEQAAIVAPRLAAMGHDVAISAMTGLAQRADRWEGIPCLPSGLTTYSNDVLGQHARSFFGQGPGLVLVLYDAWAIDPDAIQGLATAVWAPVHSWPLSGGDKRFWVASGAQPIAISRYGEKLMREFGLSPAYVPHGIDCQTFRPLDASERSEARKVMGVPDDAFVIAIVGANKGHSPPRKAWGEQFQAFAQFRRRHKDAVLYVHSIAASPHGIDMRPMAASLGIEKSVYFSANYPQITGLYPPGFVAGVMGAADVLSNPSYGEGFGLPVVEAQACGTPVVVADNSAQPELCGAGWVVGCQPVWVPQDEAWWHVPLTGRIVKAWEAAYQARGDQKLRDQAREFALRYEADLVAATYWKPVLEMLEQYSGAAPVSPPAKGTVPLPTRESDGLHWLQRGSHTDDWIATGHEENLEPILDSMLPDGGVFVDVGAHVGRWALRLAKKASHVVAVEANPATAAVLRYHVALNDVGNVDVVNVAAWDAETSLRLDDPNGKLSGGSTRVVEDAGGTVKAAPLDRYLASEPRVDLVKLDVEGADLHALRGLAATLKRCRPSLLVERHDIYGYYQLDDLTGLIEELGYEWQHVAITLNGRNIAPYIAAKPTGGQDA